MNIYTKEMIDLSNVDKKLDSYKPKIEEIENKVSESKKILDKLVEQKENIESFIEENKLKIVSYEEKIEETKEELDNILKKNAKAKNEKEVTAASSEELIARDRLKFADEEIDRLNHIIDVKGRELEELAQDTENAQNGYDETKEIALKDFAAIDEEKSEFINQRENTTKDMSQKILAFYERIRKWAGNSAVVKVESQACYGCYLKINDKVYSDLIRGEDIMTCPHCGRVLYLEDKKEEEQQEA